MIWNENSVETRRSPGNRDFAGGLTSALPVKPARIVPLQRFPFVRSRAHTKPLSPPPNLFIRCSNSRIDDSHVASQSKFPPTLEHPPFLERFFLLRDFRIERVRIGSKPYRNAIRRTLLRNIRISRNRTEERKRRKEKRDF